MSGMMLEASHEASIRILKGTLITLSTTKRAWETDRDKALAELAGLNLRIAEIEKSIQVLMGAGEGS